MKFLMSIEAQIFCIHSLTDHHLGYLSRLGALQNQSVTFYACIKNYTDKGNLGLETFDIEQSFDFDSSTKSTGD